MSFATRMLPSHHRALHDIVACRTEQMGGHLYGCENPDCEHLVYAYHSCGNRSCPKCGQDKTQRWIEKQHNRLLSTHYFPATFTLPIELRPIARSNQKVIYNLLFKSSIADFYRLIKETCRPLPNICWAKARVQRSPKPPANSLSARIAGQSCAGSNRYYVLAPQNINFLFDSITGDQEAGNDDITNSEGLRFRPIC